VPQDGRLVNLETPATIWQAEAVPVRELLRVAEHGERCGVPADWE
jgi:hypothetical protein